MFALRFDMNERTAHWQSNEMVLEWPRRVVTGALPSEDSINEVKILKNEL